VLLSPVSINFPKPLALRYEYLGDALEACKQSYAFTVIDAPRLTMEVAATVAGASRLVLVALQLTVKDIQIARFMMEALAGYGIPEDRVLAVINRYHRKGSPIRLDEARRALGTPQVRCVDNDFRSAVQAINFGQPLAQTAPTSALRRAIRELAAEIGLQSPAAKASSDA
jgi:Flp pilus assembly CpaE family ATPase